MFYTYMPAVVDDTTVISASLLNYFRVNVARALDGVGGGSYTPSAVINVQGAGFGTVDVATLMEVKPGGQLVHAVGPAIDNTNNQTFTLAAGQVRAFAAPTGARVHDLSAVGVATGSWIHFTRPAAGVNNIDINRAGFGAVYIVRLPASTWSSATVYYDGANWRLLKTSAGTPGADA